MKKKLTEAVLRKVTNGWILEVTLKPEIKTGSSELENREYVELSLNDAINTMKQLEEVNTAL